MFVWCSCCSKNTDHFELLYVTDSCNIDFKVKYAPNRSKIASFSDFVFEKSVTSNL